MNRTTLRRERGDITRYIKPTEQLAHDGEQRRKLRRHRRANPRPHREHQLARRVSASVRRDLDHSSVIDVVAHKRFARADVGPQRLGKCQLLTHACFGSNKTRRRLEECALVQSHIEDRKPRPCGFGVEQHVRHVVLVRRFLRTRQKSRAAVKDGVVVDGRDVERATLCQEAHARLRFELAPDFVRPNCKRRVLRTFANREPRDARVAMCRAKCVRRIETIDAQHTRLFLGQLIRGRCARCAQPDHDHVVVRHYSPAASRCG